MIGYRFVNAMVQRIDFTRRDWIKFSDTCPYCRSHASRMHQPEFVKRAWFRFYSSNTKSGKGTIDRGGSIYRHGKLFKLYWRLHPEHG